MSDPHAEGGMAKKKTTTKPKPKPAGRRCTAITKSGERCKHAAVAGGRCAMPAHAKPVYQARASLADLARQVRSKTAYPEDIVRANTPEEMHRLSQQQEALINALGRETWDRLTAREKVAIRCYLLERANITRAAMRAGFARNFFYEEHRSPAFREALDHAEYVAHDLIEYEVTKRGYAGSDKLVRYKGMPVPITDPRVPVIKDPDTNEPYMVRAPWDPDTLIEFRGYETDTEYSDTIGLHTIKSIKPEKYNSPPAREVDVRTTDPQAVMAKVAAQLGLDSDDDTLDQSYKIED